MVIKKVYEKVDKMNINIIPEFCSAPKYDVVSVNQTADKFGNRGIVRGLISMFDVYGQPPI